MVIVIGLCTLALTASRREFLHTGPLRHDRFRHPFRVKVNLNLKLDELTNTSLSSPVCLLMLMDDAAVTWKAELHTYFAA